MTRDNTISRRTAMKLTGATAATALVAGCSDSGGGGGGEGEDGGNQSGDGSGGAQQIEPGRIVLRAETSGWVGQEPSSIADQTNPTLALQEGEEYELGWEEGDGSGHNIEVLDSNGEVVTADGEELSTDVSSEGGDDQFLTFTASSEMAEYQCQPHQNSMHGELQIEGGSGGSGNESEGGNESENESEGGENSSGSEH